MRKNYALKTFIFVVALIILFIPSNASAYTKQGFAMKRQISLMGCLFLVNRISLCGFFLFASPF